MLVDKQSQLMSDLLFTVHQHGGDDVTWKPPIWTRFANVNMWVKFLSRNYTSFQNLHQIPILSSIYWGLQFVCLYLVSLFDFISAKKLRHENCTTKFPLALDMSRVSWKSRFRPDCVTYPIFTPHPFLRDSPGTRLHDTQRLFLICVKENPSLTYML